jgi:hypothetical protein
MPPKPTSTRGDDIRPDGILTLLRPDTCNSILLHTLSNSTSKCRWPASSGRSLDLRNSTVQTTSCPGHEGLELARVKRLWMAEPKIPKLVDRRVGRLSQQRWRCTAWKQSPRMPRPSLGSTTMTLIHYLIKERLIRCKSKAPMPTREKLLRTTERDR